MSVSIDLGEFGLDDSFDAVTFYDFIAGDVHGDTLLSNLQLGVDPADVTVALPQSAKLARRTAVRKIHLCYFKDRDPVKIALAHQTLTQQGPGEPESMLEYAGEIQRWLTKPWPGKGTIFPQAPKPYDWGKAHLISEFIEGTDARNVFQELAAARDAALKQLESSGLKKEAKENIVERIRSGDTNSLDEEVVAELRQADQGIAGYYKALIRLSAKAQAIWTLEQSMITGVARGGRFRDYKVDLGQNSYKAKNLESYLYHSMKRLGIESNIKLKEQILGSALVEKLFQSMLSASFAFPGGPEMGWIIHGDLSTDNIMLPGFQPGMPPEELEEIARVIDYTSMRMGSPYFDLACLMASPSAHLLGNLAVPGFDPLETYTEAVSEALEASKSKLDLVEILFSRDDQRSQRTELYGTNQFAVAWRGFAFADMDPGMSPGERRQNLRSQARILERTVADELSRIDTRKRKDREYASSLTALMNEVILPTQSLATP